MCAGRNRTGGQSAEAYAYDAAGNRLTANGSAYRIGADNRLLSDGTFAYAYDAEGNRTARFVDANADGLLDAGDTDVTEYAYDARNRLIRATERATAGGAATQVVDYLYDVEDRWIGEEVDRDGDGTVDHETRFAYDGAQIVLQFDKDFTTPLASGEEQGGGLTGADLSHRYLWQPNAVDQLLADERTHLDTGNIAADEVLWALTDQQGTVRDLAAVDGESGQTSVVNHRMFDAFGNLLSATDPATGAAAAADSLIGLTGRPLVSATGLQNNWHRWYDAATGQWISKDPIGFTAGDANTGRYCGNSPTNGTDPSGLWTIGTVATPPVHEVITFKAALQAGFTYQPPQPTDPNQPGPMNWLHYLGTPGSSANYFGWGLLDGCRWTDVPENVMVLGDLFNLALQPKVKKIVSFWNHKQHRPTISSHFGDLQYHHSMWPHLNPTDQGLGMALGLPASAVKKQIVDWICQQYSVALQKKQAADQASAEINKKHPLTSSLHMGKANNLYQEAGFELGKVIHTIEDSYSPSHVWRNADGTIHAFEDYSIQDPKKHKQADEWANLPLDANPVTAQPTWSNTAIGNEQKAGYAKAVHAVAQLLTFYNTGAKVQDVQNWFDTNVFALDDYASTDRPAGGQSDPLYLPDKK